MFKDLFKAKKLTESDLDLTAVPRHIAIIMDGNRRWARKRRLPRNAGHQKGVKTLKQICYACKDLKIQYLSAYAFSTENWQRPVNEVNFLMDLFKKTFREELEELVEENVRVRIIGRREGIDTNLLCLMEDLERKTVTNDGFNLNICLNYGSRAEIIDAVNKILVEKNRPREIDEEYFEKFLYTSGLPDVELVIRTSGEQRLSNFLLYQSAYAEFVFTPIYWPEFSKKDLIRAVWEFQNRDRRFGRI